LSPVLGDVLVVGSTRVLLRDWLDQNATGRCKEYHVHANLQRLVHTIDNGGVALFKKDLIKEHYRVRQLS
jgi:hypothetical protein